MSYANNKGADQPAHPRSLISAFVVRCLDSVMSSFCNQNFKPHSSFCSWAGQFESDLVGNSRRHVFSWLGSHEIIRYANPQTCTFPYDHLESSCQEERTLESQHDKTNKMTWAPSEDSDQPGHPPSLIRVLALHLMGSWGPKVSSCWQRRFWSVWAEAQADLNLRWAHRSFCLTCDGSLDIRIKTIGRLVVKRNTRPLHLRGPPRGLGNRRKRTFISGEQWNKGPNMRRSGKEREFWGK